MENVKPKKRNFTTEYKWWLDSEKLLKLEQAFAIGCTDKEACSYAEITEHQLYYYQNEINKDFAARKEELKEKPILKARQTVVKSLDEPEHAKWYLERKRKNEFSQRIETPLTDTPVVNTYNFIFNEATRKEIKQIEDKLKERLLNVPKTEENNQIEQERP